MPTPSSDPAPPPKKKWNVHLAFGSRCSPKFPTDFRFLYKKNFKLRYEDSENIKTDRLYRAVFNFHKTKQRNVFGTPSNVRSFFPNLHRFIELPCTLNLICDESNSLILKNNCPDVINWPNRANR